MYFVCVQKFSPFNNSTVCKHQPNQDNLWQMKNSENGIKMFRRE